MRIFTTVLLILAIGLIGFNATMLNFTNLFDGNSLIALIGIIASICAILILLIFIVSKKIEQKLKA